ncbi:MAG: serine hydrolase domain-containing protein [Dehalococcoidia bacterium]|nr:serine hydrolase domain-containing protein [Dehalococcoidia bacterium]
MFKELEEVIRSEMERTQVPGLAIALVKGQEIVWSQGYGYADIKTKSPVTSATVFRIQSATKPVVATALMQWYERDRFKLDDPVNQHTGAIRVHSEWEKTTPVTIRHLLTHTAGFPPAASVAAFIGQSELPTLEEYVAAVARTTQPPGRGIVYTDISYAVIGYLVGRFAGQPYDVYLRENVLKPLGMESSGIAHPPQGTVATGYFLSRVDGEHHEVSVPLLVCKPGSPAGALLSTVDDLGRFLVAHLNIGVYEGRRILREETVAEMHGLHARAGRSQSGIGLGFMVYDVDGRRQVCHGGGAPGWAALIAAYPEEKVGVAILTNMDGAFYTLPMVADVALNGLLGQLRRHDMSRLKRWPVPDDWNRVAGRYSLRYQDAIVAIEGDLLTVEVGGMKSYMEHQHDGLFRAHDGFFGGCQITFEYGSDGEATRFYGGNYPFWFERQEDAGAATQLAVDEEGDPVGCWHGTCSSLLGPMPLTLRIGDVGTATVTAPTVQDAAVQQFRVDRGSVSGHFDISLRGFGEFRVFLRLSARGGKLQGQAYARGAIGEYPMPTELTRES